MLITVFILAGGNLKSILAQIIFFNNGYICSAEVAFTPVVQDKRAVYCWTGRNIRSLGKLISKNITGNFYIFLHRVFQPHR